MIHEDYCNEEIHNYLRGEDEYYMCQFCNLQLEYYKPIAIQKCCKTPNFIIDKGKVCTNCGVIDFYYKSILPYIDFHENKWKFRQKSIYNPKYVILKTLYSYKTNQIKHLTYNTQDKILRICKEIYKIKNNRKRMVSILYIIRLIFEMMNMEYKFIPLPKSKKTRIYYIKWRKNIIKLIGDKINLIIQK